MIELLFVTCLSASPKVCEEHSMLYTDMSAMTCLMQAQPELAKWTESHQRWKVTSWKCRAFDASREHDA